MKSRCWQHAAAPSPMLLRYLRLQAERQSTESPLAGLTQRTCYRQLGLAQGACFSTSSRRRATAQSTSSPVSFTYLPPRRNFPQQFYAHLKSRELRESQAVTKHYTQPPSFDYGNRRFASLWASLGLGRSKKERSGDRKGLSPLASFLDDNGTGFSGRMPRATNELKLRCTEFDGNGNVTLVNGEFKKTELIAKYGLLPRDLRKIDSSLLPHLMVRPSAILINLLHLRVLIKHNRVLVFDAYGTSDSYTQSVFMYDLEGKLRQKDTRQSGALPYEFRALEAVLLSVTSGLESEFEGVSEPVLRVLQELEEDIDRDKLRYLLIYSKKLGTFEQKARLVRDALDELLEADDDLSAMYLTDKANGTVREEEDHTEVEMLLESYHKVAEEITQAAENLVSSIRNTEEIIRAILDANRNSLMLLDLKFSVGTLGLGAGTFVAALYGMNLKNFIEESDLGFWGVSAWCFVFSVVVCYYGLTKLRKVQRVSMWGEHGRGNNAWRVGGYDNNGRSVGALGPGAGVAGVGGVPGVPGVPRVPGPGKAERQEWLREKHEHHGQFKRQWSEQQKQSHWEKEREMWLKRKEKMGDDS